MEKYIFKKNISVIQSNMKYAIQYVHGKERKMHCVVIMHSFCFTPVLDIIKKRFERHFREKGLYSTIIYIKRYKG